MTGNDVYKSACALLFENPFEDKFFSDSAVRLINLLILEALPTQNSRERVRGEAETGAFFIESLDDVIKLDSEIVKLALPYGLASFFHQDEENQHLAQEYRSRFIVALEELKKIGFSDITDEYPIDSEE